MSSTSGAKDVQSLLKHGDWLRRLAVHLAGGDPDADDAVQDTWLAAFRRPPSEGRDARPWLTRVLANALRKRWRGQT